jgi:hypothetical protein
VENVARPEVPLIDDVFLCGSGGAHKLMYLGRDSQAYRCEGCGRYVSKARLGEATNPNPPTAEQALLIQLREAEIRQEVTRVQ